MLTTLAWILGQAPAIADRDRLAYRDFWHVLAELPFFREAAKRQIHDADLAVLLRHYTVPTELQTFAGLLVRHDLLIHDRLVTLDDARAMPRAKALTWLLQLCQALGPEPEWQRYRLEKVSNGALDLSRGDARIQIDLGGIRHYVTEVGGRLEFVEEPSLEEWDRIYTLSAPFPTNVLKVKESGGVASVDRFSAYDSWVDKKDVSTLETRARRYVRGLSGIKDVRVLKRSDTGRGTLLE